MFSGAMTMAVQDEDGKSVQFNIRGRPDDRDALKDMAKRMGRDWNMSKIVRQFVETYEDADKSELRRVLLGLDSPSGVTPRLIPNDIKMYRMGGHIAAGPWLEVPEGQREEMLSSVDLLNWQDGDYLLQIDGDDGDCLIGDGIWPNDIVHLRPGLKHEAADIVHVRGEDRQGRPFITLKHWHPIPSDTSMIELRPSNPKRKPIVAHKATIIVDGVMVGFTHRGRARRKQ